MHKVHTRTLVPALAIIPNLAPAMLRTLLDGHRTVFQW